MRTGAPELVLILAGVMPRARRVMRALWEFARVKPLGAVGAAIIAIAVLVAAVGPMVVPHDPLQTNVGMRNVAPNSRFLLGTDSFGRDVLARVVVGGRVSLVVGLTAAALGVFGGGLVGIVGGYVGGAFDMVLQRLVDILMSFPTLILAIALITVLEPGLDKVILAIGIITVSQSIRVLRSTTLSIKEMVYVDAARAIGAPGLRVVFFHILPNTMAPFIVVYSVVFGSAIMVEASLSYLGLGVPPPTSSWGGMLTNAQKFARSAPWVVFSAGIPIVLIVLASNLLGDALRDYLDPRLRRVQRITKGR